MSVSASPGPRRAMIIATCIRRPGHVSDTTPTPGRCAGRARRRQFATRSSGTVNQRTAGPSAGVPAAASEAASLATWLRTSHGDAQRPARGRSLACDRRDARERTNPDLQRARRRGLNLRHDLRGRSGRAVAEHERPRRHRALDGGRRPAADDDLGLRPHALRAGGRAGRTGRIPLALPKLLHPAARAHLVRGQGRQAPAGIEPTGGPPAPAPPRRPPAGRSPARHGGETAAAPAGSPPRRAGRPVASTAAAISSRSARESGARSSSGTPVSSCSSFASARRRLKRSSTPSSSLRALSRYATRPAFLTSASPRFRPKARVPA